MCVCRGEGDLVVFLAAEIPTMVEAEISSSLPVLRRAELTTVPGRGRSGWAPRDLTLYVILGLGIQYSSRVIASIFIELNN